MLRLSIASCCILLSAVSAWAAPRESSRLLLTNDAWKGVAATPLTVDELNRLVQSEAGYKLGEAAALVSDEVFLRRVSLDLVGKQPSASAIAAFVADRSPNKRAAKIDELLASEDYAKHWARYWYDVVLSRVTGQQERALSMPFLEWLTDEFKKNRPWDAMTRAMVEATGEIRLPPPPAAMMPGQAMPPRPRDGNGPPRVSGNGAAYLLIAHNGPDGINDRTSEISRIFLGIQISCAQCHDHPFDEWKQVQFHELASFLARVRDRRFPPQTGLGFGLTQARFAEHEMPDRDNPGKGTRVSPRFLDGSTPGSNLPDDKRRAALADKLTKDNYWFAAAFVNRHWAMLTGQGFFNSAVDDIGPSRQVVLPQTLARLSASFQASGFDIKALLRLIANSEAYQRNILPRSAPDQHLRFAGVTPTKVRPHTLYNSLNQVLGDLTPPFARLFAGAVPPAGGFARMDRFAPFALTFEREFDFDPSAKSDEVEHSIPQALLMMNNPTINGRITASRGSVLDKILRDHSDDQSAVNALYRHTLSRQPTDRESTKALTYIRKVGKRAEAFEDLFWVLVNSTEFQTKR